MKHTSSIMEAPLCCPLDEEEPWKTYGILVQAHSNTKQQQADLPRNFPCQGLPGASEGCEGQFQYVPVNILFIGHQLAVWRLVFSKNHPFRDFPIFYVRYQSVHIFVAYYVGQVSASFCWRVPKEM